MGAPCTTTLSNLSWTLLFPCRGKTCKSDVELTIDMSTVDIFLLHQTYSSVTEAEYAFQQRKEVIPLLMQPGYVPDGWLGALVGARLYFDFTVETEFEAQALRLVKELGNRGRMPCAPRIAELRAAVDDSHSSQTDSVDSMYNSWQKFLANFHKVCLIRFCPNCGLWFLLWILWLILALWCHL